MMTRVDDECPKGGCKVCTVRQLRECADAGIDEAFEELESIADPDDWSYKVEVLDQEPEQNPGVDDWLESAYEDRVSGGGDE